MRKWLVQTADPAGADLFAIFDYIAFTLMEPQTAAKQTERIRAQIKQLNQMPERFPIYDREPWKSRGFRRMNVDNYSVLYTTDEASGTVTVLRVLYGKRDISALLQEDDS